MDRIQTKLCKDGVFPITRLHGFEFLSAKLEAFSSGFLSALYALKRE